MALTGYARQTLDVALGGPGASDEIADALDNSAKTNDANTFTGDLTFSAGADLVFATSGAGTKIGTGATQLLGFYGATAVDRPAALTAQLTSITHTAPGTPDYAIQALTTTTPFGFVSADEGNTVLSVILNLQVRLAEVEARLEELGLVAAN